MDYSGPGKKGVWTSGGSFFMFIACGRETRVKEGGTLAPHESLFLGGKPHTMPASVLVSVETGQPCLPKHQDRGGGGRFSNLLVVLTSIFAFEFSWAPETGAFAPAGCTLKRTASLEASCGTPSRRATKTLLA